MMRSSRLPKLYCSVLTAEPVSSATSRNRVASAPRSAITRRAPCKTSSLPRPARRRRWTWSRISVWFSHTETLPGGNPLLQESPSALVSGAGTGIGRATALLLAESDYCVALVGRRPEPLDRVKDEITAEGGRAETISADVGSPDRAESAVAATLESFGRLDALICNHGVEQAHRSATTRRKGGIRRFASTSPGRFCWPERRSRTSSHRAGRSSTLARPTAFRRGRAGRRTTCRRRA